MKEKAGRVVIDWNEVMSQTGKGTGGDGGEGCGISRDDRTFLD